MESLRSIVVVVERHRYIRAVRRDRLLAEKPGFYKAAAADRGWMVCATSCSVATRISKRDVHRRDRISYAEAWSLCSCIKDHARCGDA